MGHTKFFARPRDEMMDHPHLPIPASYVPIHHCRFAMTDFLPSLPLSNTVKTDLVGKTLSTTLGGVAFFPQEYDGSTIMEWPDVLHRNYTVFLVLRRPNTSIFDVVLQ
jgi:hypothetical protein